MPYPHLDRLLDLLARLRRRSPWDQRQTPASAARFLTDEAHELCDAAANDQPDQIRAELADLLYMVAFNWLLHNERDPTDFDQLAEQAVDKLERRLGHVLGEDPPPTVLESGSQWRHAKAQEAKSKGQDPGPPSLLKDLSPSTSPLRQAYLHTEYASRVGFEWPDHTSAMGKIYEELDEVKDAIANGSQAHIAEEVGDLLFGAVQLARMLGVDPDHALRSTNVKFARRFRTIEAHFDHDVNRLAGATLDELHEVWQRAKRDEGQSDSGQPSSSSTPS